MKSTAQSPVLPKELEALRATIDSRLSALEKALADPTQHGSLESLILDLARIATEEAHATARHAVLDAQKAGQQAVAAARTEGAAALEAEKAETAALRQVIESAKSALTQAEAMLKDQRRAAEAASQEAAGARRELEALRDQLEREQSARVDARRELEGALAAAEDERMRASSLAQQAMQARSQDDTEKSALAADLEQHRAALETERAAVAGLLQARSALEGRLESAQRDLDIVRQAQGASASDAEERVEAAIRERDALHSERLELQRQLQAAEAALREARDVNRELQAAHEARDAAEVLEETPQAEERAEPEFDIETVVDLTSITQDEERQHALEQRARALEQALREAEARAESAESELARHRRSTPSGAAARPEPVTPAAAPSQTATGQPEQFRGPARGARRTAFKADIPLHVDGNPGKLVDLSVTGAQVLTPSAINPNRLVSVTLPTPEGAIACKAKVMWSRLEPRAGQLWYRAGVHFTNVDQRALESFLSSHQS